MDLPAASSARENSFVVAEVRRRKHTFDLKGACRDHSMIKFAAFVETQAASQIQALHQPALCGTAARVVCVRHGMGHHNDAFETASCMNRDAELNSIGVTQASQAGELLQLAGLFDSPERLRT